MVIFHRYVSLPEGNHGKKMVGKWSNGGFNMMVVPPKWMVYLMELPLKWMMWGYPYFRNPPIVTLTIREKLCFKHETSRTCGEQIGFETMAHHYDLIC
jgi:hypothetical protein